MGVSLKGGGLSYKEGVGRWGAFHFVEIFHLVEIFAINE